MTNTIHVHDVACICILYVTDYLYLTHDCVYLFLEDACKDGGQTSKGRERLRRSGVGKIERARVRTLKMTVMIGKYSLTYMFSHTYIDVGVVIS